MPDSRVHVMRLHGERGRVHAPQCVGARVAHPAALERDNPCGRREVLACAVTTNGHVRASVTQRTATTPGCWQQHVQFVVAGQHLPVRSISSSRHWKDSERLAACSCQYTAVRWKMDVGVSGVRFLRSPAPQRRYSSCKVKQQHLSRHIKRGVTYTRAAGRAAGHTQATNMTAPCRAQSRRL